MTKVEISCKLEGLVKIVVEVVFKVGVVDEADEILLEMTVDTRIKEVFVENERT